MPSRKENATPEILAVIPARGGSKGVPRKNIRPLLGKPLLSWMLAAAEKSKYITRIIVATDDDEIASIARSLGAEVPYMQPPEVSHDLATDVEYLSYALSVLREKEGYVPDIILRLPPTSPLCTSEHIDMGIKVLLADPGLDAVRPICETPKHPYKFWKIHEDQKHLEPFLPKSFTGFDEPHNLQRQRFPKVYMHTGAMDVIRCDTLMKQRSTSGKKLGYFHMSLEDSVNIDHPLDFEIAELLMKKRLGLS
jgi:CMP-N-acetylneuraminic acid synthetase